MTKYNDCVLNPQAIKYLGINKYYLKCNLSDNYFSVIKISWSDEAFNISSETTWIFQYYLMQMMLNSKNNTTSCKILNLLKNIF